MIFQNNFHIENFHTKRTVQQFEKRATKIQNLIPPLLGPLTGPIVARELIDRSNGRCDQITAPNLESVSLYYTAHCPLCKREQSAWFRPSLVSNFFFKFLNFLNTSKFFYTHKFLTFSPHRFNFNQTFSFSVN